ncbi:hypothetical protein VNI00_006335 [Paramarasmius palmivorus]|uniref:Uncharacterized protein n=1 Tax=Paramarasmius palmivorus TaxID=297713 RepID=A0AAW0D8N0_9AGAR
MVSIWLARDVGPVHKDEDDINTSRTPISTLPAPHLSYHLPLLPYPSPSLTAVSPLNSNVEFVYAYDKESMLALIADLCVPLHRTKGDASSSGHHVHWLSLESSIEAGLPAGGEAAQVS